MRIPDLTRQPWLLAMALVAAAGLFVSADCGDDEAGVAIPIVFVTPRGNVGNPGDTVAFGFDLNNQIRNNRYDRLHWNFGGGATPNSITTAARSIMVVLGPEGTYHGQVTTEFDSSLTQRYQFEFTVVD